MAGRGPGGGALLAEPVNLAGEAGSLLFDALLASVSPPGLTSGVPLRLPLAGRNAGEVHRFASQPPDRSIEHCRCDRGRSEQVIYVSGSPASSSEETGTVGLLSSSSVRRLLEEDLRWAEQVGLPVFIVRPDKQGCGCSSFRAGRCPEEISSPPWPSRRTGNETPFACSSVQSWARRHQLQDHWMAGRGAPGWVVVFQAKGSVAKRNGARESFEGTRQPGTTNRSRMKSWMTACLD